MTNSITPENNGTSKKLKELLKVIEASGHSILPRSNDDLLQSIVEAAGRIFNAAAASILLANEKEQVLEFKAAYGSSNRSLVGEKFPIGRGIAGYVVLSGQPLTISNVQEDTRFNQDFAKSTGYIPKSILAMPLKSGERVLGVIEVLDKLNASTFGLQDMELLGMFAHQAAIAIDQSQRMDQLQTAFVAGLKNIAKSNGKDIAELFPKIAKGDDHGSQADLLELGNILYKVSQLGEREHQSCLEVLKVFANYQDSSRKRRYVR